MLNTFLEWIGLKQKLHDKDAYPVFFKEGDIWWCALGQNIGVEVNGKGNRFSRPVLVYKKLSKEGFLGLPLSTKQRTGSWYVSITFQDTEQIVNLAQARVLSAARMYTKLGELDRVDRDRVQEGFRALY